ncbi:MAG: FimV/HubP family polar landmark protein [Wenzhouxiangellaceae bacterium]|nr:FimV/HubP family polar landmark protein [Wenzhouxiangellaceae bacterium]
MSRGEGNWIIRIACALVLAASSGVYALGLGEARVDSYLNQPLEVRMRLLEATEDNLDSLTVSIASPADYERLGLSAAALALDLDVAIDRSQTPPVIRVRSSRPVTDPVVQLLVDARWSSARLLREYTLFLDPPTVAVAPPPARRPVPEPEPDEPAPGADTQAAAAPRAAPPDRPEPRPVPERASERPSAIQATAGGRYGPVVSGDTLWSIASAARSAGEVSMNQMMIAILELNPQAFANGNINRLLRGAELELPTADEARRISEAEAAAAVAAQNRAFRRLRTGELPVVADAARSEAPSERGAERATGAARPEDSPEPGAETPEHRLALVPPTDEEGGAGDQSDVEQLRRQLARAEEELYAARQEAEEFRARLGDLEAAVRNNPGALGIRDAELAGLEETLREARLAVEPGADPELRAEASRRIGEVLERLAAAPEDGAAAIAEPTDDAEPAMAATADAQTPRTEPGTTEPVPSPEPAPERTVTQVDSGGNLFDRVLGRPMLLLGLGLLVLIAILGGLRVALRRRRSELERRARPLRRASEVRPEPKADNPEARARAAVESNPNDLAAHLALLQTLASAGREDHFGEALEEMFERVGSGEEPEWRAALDLAGQVVPGHGLVKGSSDWVADSEDLSEEDLEPKSELEDEARVDDLMSRLDADLDSSDDEEWLGGGQGRPGPDETGDEWLREKDVEDDAGAPGFGAGDDDSDQLLDFESPGDEAAGQVGGERSDEQASEPMPRAAGEDEGEPAEAGPDEPEQRDPEQGESGDLVLDWTSGEDESAEEPASAGASEEPPGAEESGDADDIFAPGDDDVEVKLDLARAYLSWNSNDSARTLLEEVVREGNDDQRAQARKLLDELGGDADA